VAIMAQDHLGLCQFALGIEQNRRLKGSVRCSVSWHKFGALGGSEAVKYVARHTGVCDLLRILGLVRVLSNLGSGKGENRIFWPSLAALVSSWRFDRFGGING